MMLLSLQKNYMNISWFYDIPECIQTLLLWSSFKFWVIFFFLNFARKTFSKSQICKITPQIVSNLKNDIKNELSIKN